MWLVRLLMRKACVRRPRLAALEDGAGIDVGLLDVELAGVHLEVVLSVGNGALEHLDDVLAGGLGVFSMRAWREAASLPRIMSQIICTLRGRCGRICLRPRGFQFFHVFSPYLPVLPPAWPRKVRVGRELAQLVADHVLGDVDGNVRRPSWTAMVCPTKDGNIVEARLQVFRTFFSPALLSSSTRFSSSGRRRGLS